MKRTNLFVKMFIWLGGGGGYRFNTVERKRSSKLGLEDRDLWSVGLGEGVVEHCRSVMHILLEARILGTRLCCLPGYINLFN